MFFNGKYRILKKMNYVADQKGIIERYLKESESWAAHLENTKQAIIRGAENKATESCAILGSGWLLDVPIDFLAQKFKKVYLFDVLHPTQIKHKMRKYPNFVCVEQDITGGAIEEFFSSVQLNKSMKKRKELADFNFNGFSYKIAFDYIASVNILNQLDILLIDYIKDYNLYTEQELQQLRVSIQQKHINSLPAGKSCLITDFEELIFSKQNELEDTLKLIHIPLPESKIASSWQWNFDHHDYVSGKNVTFNVLTLDL
jgi:hypothetical protein